MFHCAGKPMSPRLRGEFRRVLAGAGGAGGCWRGWRGWRALAGAGRRWRWCIKPDACPPAFMLQSSEMPSAVTFEEFEKELNRLVESFGGRIAELKKPGYSEAQLRDDFLNPMFRALGWDMENRAGLIQREREVGASDPLHTSDQPFTRFPHKHSPYRNFTGYGSPGIQLNFPLSPRFSLSLLERGYFQKLANFDGRVRDVPLLPENVQHENSLQVLHSSRFIFSPKDDFLMAKEMCDENPDLRNHHRAQFDTSNPRFQNKGTLRKSRDDVTG